MTTVDAIKFFGGRKKLAEALGIWPHSTYGWGVTPPMLRQFQLQRLTRGRLTADE